MKGLVMQTNNRTAITNTSYGNPLTQDGINLYWSIYKNLEKELIALTDIIYIDDAQKGVYSVRIAELIIRTSTEIESLCKDLFATLGVPFNKKILYFDGHCIQEFATRWDIEKKAVEIIHPFIRFTQRELTPFRNAIERTATSSNPNKWKLAYNDVMHNFRNLLSSATIEVFIEALAALYLLNVYARGYNKSISLPSRENAENFDATMGSSLFALKVQKVFDAKCVSADKIELANVPYRPECTYRIDPVHKSLVGIQEVLKKCHEEARGYVKTAAFDLIHSGEIKLPSVSGALSQADTEKISLKAEELALGNHHKEFCRAVTAMQYTASLVCPPQTTPPPTVPQM
jgi:hypothetical protein